MAGVIPSKTAWGRVSAVVREHEREPFVARGKRVPRIFSSPSPLRRVRPTANASGGGKYTGYVVSAPTGTLSATGNVSAAELGENGGACLIYNAAEEGKTTHGLTVGTPTQKTFIGFYLGMSDDSPAKPVYMVNGFDSEDCA